MIPIIVVFYWYVKKNSESFDPEFFFVSVNFLLSDRFL